MAPWSFGRGNSPRLLDQAVDGVHFETTIDMKDSPPKDYLSPFREPVQDLKGIEADAGGKIFSGSFQRTVINDFRYLQRILQLRRPQSRH